jgi:hypothetical protein
MKNGVGPDQTGIDLFKHFVKILSAGLIDLPFFHQIYDFFS